MNPQRIDPPAEIHSARLLLRAYRLEDCGEYFHAIRANLEHLREFLPTNLAEMQTEADAETFLRWQAGEWQARRLFLFGAWETATGCYVGEAYLANPDWHVPSLELGYFLLEDAIGQGYASEAAQAVLGWAFAQFELVRVDLQCRADNPASQRVAERCGFRQEGCQRLRHRKKNGELVDLLWYGLLREEFSFN